MRVNPGQGTSLTSPDQRSGNYCQDLALEQTSGYSLDDNNGQQERMSVSTLLSEMVDISEMTGCHYRPVVLH